MEGCCMISRQLSKAVADGMQLLLHAVVAVHALVNADGLMCTATISLLLLIDATLDSQWSTCDAV